TESLQELHIKGVPDHVLKLKTGMPLIITRNIDKAAKLCNGTKVYVTRLLQYQIGVKRFVDDDDDDEATEYILPRINFLTDGEGTLPFQMLRRQLPVKPAWCITIHKAQGQSLQAAGLYIKHPESIFTHGQLYVALSRTRNPRNLRI
ncbi:P-loop containing nucleoside triphosphate hydrolase protein, partial [Gongronella butleri]